MATAEPNDSLILANDQDNSATTQIAEIEIPYDVYSKLEKGDIQFFNEWVTENSPDGNSKFFLDKYLNLDTRLFPNNSILDFTNVRIKNLEFYGESDNTITVQGGIYTSIGVQSNNVTLDNVITEELAFHEGYSNITVANSSAENAQIYTGEDGESLAYLKVEKSEIGFVDFSRSSLVELELNDNTIKNIDLGRANVEGGSFINTEITDRAWFFEAQINRTDLSGFNGSNLIFKYSEIDENTLDTSDAIKAEYQADNTPVVTAEIIIEPNVNQNPTELVVKLLDHNEGVFLGDRHDKLNFPLWIAESMDEFRDAQVDTLYFEMVAYTDNNILDDFNAGVHGSEEVLQDYLLDYWQHSAGAAEAKYEIALAARAEGIKVKGINTQSDLESEFFLEHPSFIQRNYDWADNINAYETEEPSRRYIVFGGQIHGDGLAESHGFDTMLGIPEVGIADDDGPATISLGEDARRDYTLTLPKTGLEGIGVAGDDFIHFEKFLGEAAEYYTGKTADGEHFQNAAEALIGMKQALESNDLNGVRNSRLLAQEAIERFPEDTKDYLLLKLERAVKVADVSNNLMSRSINPTLSPDL